MPTFLEVLFPFEKTAGEGFIAQGPISSKIWEFVMKVPTCSYMNQLGSQLIVAYRRNDGELESLSTDGVFFPSEEVTSLQEAITRHRRGCPVCFEIERTMADAVDSRLTSH